MYLAQIFLQKNFVTNRILPLPDPHSYKSPPQIYRILQILNFEVPIQTKSPAPTFDLIPN